MKGEINDEGRAYRQDSFRCGSKTDASKALDSALNAIKASLKKGRRLRLWDSGHFRSQSARQGRDATRGQVRR